MSAWRSLWRWLRLRRRRTLIDETGLTRGPWRVAWAEATLEVHLDADGTIRRAVAWGPRQPLGARSGLDVTTLRWGAGPAVSLALEAIPEARWHLIDSLGQPISGARREAQLPALRRKKLVFSSS